MNKAKAYCDLLELFAKMTDPQLQTKSNKNEQAKKNLGQEMVIIGTNIALFGSDKVIFKYIDWRVTAMGGDTVKTMDTFSVLMLEMRKDLLGKKTELVAEQMLDTILAGN